MDELKPEDLSFSAYPDQIAGGMHVGVPKGVLATHPTTGIKVVCNHYRSQHQNRDACLRAIAAALNTRPREQPHGEAFAAGKVLERTSGPVTKAMHELVAKWEKAGREHGVRQFTGNDHLLFANELKAALVAALGKSNG